MDQRKKRLYKSRTNKKLCGVCGGLAEYLEVDATIIRLGWILMSCCTFSFGFLAYIIAALIMPYEENC